MVIAFDTMVAAHLLNEELPLSLLSTCVMELGVDDWGKGKHSFGDGVYPPSPLWGDDGMGTYCAMDVAYTHLLYERQRDKLRANQDLAKLMKFLVLPGLEATCRMERNGIWVDQMRVDVRKAEMGEKLESLRSQMLEHVSDDFRETADFGNEHFLRKWLFTPAPSGLGLRPIAFTEKTNSPKVDEATLQELRHPAVDILMEFRKSTKMLQFFEAWPTWYDPESRIHPHFNLTGTVTGRRSCDKPNLQQVPRNHLARSCFGAPPGWLMLEFDYSTAEVRIAAWLAEEDTLLKIFADPAQDVYRYTAAIIYGKPESEVTKEERQGAKAVVLGFLYGMSARGFIIYAKQTFGVEFTLEQGEEFRRVYFQTYPRLVSWHERQRRAAAKNRMVSGPIGRARHLMNILSSDRLSVLKAERQAINSPVQGFGGDLTLATSVSLMDVLDPNEILMVGDIHDALLFQVREDVWEKWAYTILIAMEDPPALKPFNIHIPVRMKAEGKVSSHWGHMGPLTYLKNGKPTHEFALQDFSAPGILRNEWTFDRAS